MNTSKIERQLLEDRRYWQGVADHTLEHATMDPQSNYAFRTAQDKLAAIDRVLRKMLIGAFGRCDECGGPIEPERLELLVDSDCHLCAKCAAMLKARKTLVPVTSRARSIHHRSPALMEII